jgi:transcriptional regulator with XRE-family HTH domain
MSDPAAIVRAERVARNLRQSDLADLLGVTQGFVSQLERGLVELPSDEVRAKLVEHLGVDPFAERAAERDGKVSASEFSRRTNVDIHSVLRLIAEDLLPARFLGDGNGYELDEREALAALDALPRCRYESCDEPATSETGCCGEHGQRQWALEARGTKRPADVGERIRLAHLTTHANPERGPRWRAGISRANRGRPRPDVRERVAEMHADSKQHAEWGLATMEGRAKGRRTIAKPSDKIPGTTMRRWKNRVNGHKGHRPANAERDWYEEAADKVLELHAKNKQLGARTLAERATRELGREVTRYFVEQVLGQS